MKNPSNESWKDENGKKKFKSTQYGFIRIAIYVTQWKRSIECQKNSKREWGELKICKW